MKSVQWGGKFYKDDTEININGLVALTEYFITI